MNFGAEVQKVVSNHVTNMDALDNEARKIEEQLKQERITGRTAAEKRQELEGKRAAAIAAAQGEINRLHQEHDAAVDAWNAPSGEKIHEDARLLQMGIELDEVQFQQLCDRHSDNSVMLRLLTQYADKHEGLYAFRPADAKSRKSAFSDFCERASGCIRNHDTLSAALFLSGNSIPKSVYYEY